MNFKFTRTTVLVAMGVVAAAALAIGIFATQNVLPSMVQAEGSKLVSFDTIPLEGLSLNPGEFLLLVDTTPAQIESGHVTISVPCKPGNNTAPSTDIAVVAGVAPDVSPVDLDYVSGLSDPDNNRCTFHVTVPKASEDITDIAIINTSDKKVKFDSGMFASTSITTAEDNNNNNSG